MIVNTVAALQSLDLKSDDELYDILKDINIEGRNVMREMEPVADLTPDQVARGMSAILLG